MFFVWLTGCRVFLFISVKSHLHIAILRKLARMARMLKSVKYSKQMAVERNQQLVKGLLVMAKEPHRLLCLYWTI